MTEESDRQYWNTEYNWRQDAQENYALWCEWRRFLIERGYTPQGVMRSAGKEKFKGLIKEFLGLPAKESCE